MVWRPGAQQVLTDAVGNDGGLLPLRRYELFNGTVSLRRNWCGR
ncbi:MAG: hypothetical protein R2932_43255 [Caldilineaceae bacterium]